MSRLEGGRSTENRFSVLAGKVIDGTGGPVQSRLLLRIESGAILSMHPASSQDLQAVRDDSLVDLLDCTILPGLIDCHVHLTMSGTDDPRIRQAQLDLSFAQAAPIISRHLDQHLSRGIVALRDGGDSAGHTLCFKQEYLNPGGFPVLVKSCGKARHARNRYGKLIGRPPAEGLTLAQDIAREADQLDHLKIVNSGINSLTEVGKPASPQFSLQELTDAVQAGLKAGCKTMVHANGAVPVSMAVEAGCHSIEHGFFMGEDNLKRMAERSIVWVPTAFTMKAYAQALRGQAGQAQAAEQYLDHQLGQIRQAKDWGVSIAVGTDSGSLGVHHGTGFVEELGLLMETGYSVEKAVECATGNGARLLGLEHRLGCIKAGMPATFLAVRGEPRDLLNALRAPKCLYVDGQAVREFSSPTASSREWG